jgi:hypothetical protein
VTPVAIMLAVAAAVTFGVAAVRQHRAVQTVLAPARRQMSIRQIAILITDGAWLRGFGLMVLGTTLHVTALTLAPISVTQPINVLAVPTTIIVVALITRRRPTRSVIIARDGCSRRRRDRLLPHRCTGRGPANSGPARRRRRGGGRVHATLDTLLGLYERLICAVGASTAIPAEATLAA